MNDTHLAAAAVDAVIVTGRSAASKVQPPQAPLTETEPETVISGDYIDNALPRTGDFASVFGIAPSIGYGGSPNGPGAGETNITMRGFQDGEYNVTYDGVPFNDTDTPTHHSTSYFPVATIGSAVVDRGPGNASQLGQANFGGSINLFSPTLTDTPHAELADTYGSFATNQVVGAAQSGVLSQLGGLRALFIGQSLDTAGYLTHSPSNEQNQFLKADLPLAPHLVASLVASHNTIVFAAPNKGGATLSQVAQFGRNFALSEDPTSPTFVGYNSIRKETNFDIFTLDFAPKPGVEIKNQAYIYTYHNLTRSALDVTGATPDKTKAGPTGNSDIPGVRKLNGYHTYGDILKGMFDVGIGKLTVGSLVEQSRTHRFLYDTDLTLGVPDPREKTSPLTVASDDHSGWTQYQPFAEFEWRPLANLSITPGVKYVHFEHDIDAAVTPVVRIPLNATEVYTDTLPFLTANYRVTPQWSIYGQYAKGFLVPPLTVFFVQDPSKGAPRPQTSTNYQIGGVYSNGRLHFDGDVYYIDFNNKIIAVGSGIDQLYTNQGGATYKGIEGEASYALAYGLGGFINGSLNSAISSTTHKQIPNAPQYTAVAGVSYAHGPLRLVFTYKLNGTQWAVSGEPSQYRIGAFGEADLNAIYALTSNILLELGAYNLGDSKAVTAIAASSASVNAATGLSPYDRYSFQAGRSFQGTLRVRF